MMRLTMILFAAALALSGCGAPIGNTSSAQSSPKSLAVATARAGTGFSVAPANAPSGPAVDNFAASFLDGLQAQSFASDSEYCGYFFLDRAGRLQATPPIRGTIASCDMPEPLAGQGVIASYHTHGGYARGYDNEVPSAVDLMSDFDYGIDGYVSTPGGRIWLVDYQTQSTRQICGLGCVRVDPRFVPDSEASILPAFTLRQLQTRNASF